MYTLGLVLFPVISELQVALKLFNTDADPIFYGIEHENSMQKLAKNSNWREYKVHHTYISETAKKLGIDRRKNDFNGVHFCFPHMKYLRL
jgi:hypothetical protein